MRLVKGFLKIIDEMNPKWWIMENVPRLSLTLPKSISLYDSAIGKKDKCFEIPNRNVLNAADYGVPQGRKRLFVGNYPSPKPSHSDKGEGGTEQWRLMRDVIEGLPYPLDEENSSNVNDPLYTGITLDCDEFTEHRYDTFLTKIEVEEAKRLKTRHRYYGKINFPDDIDRPARTVMASISRTSREMMVIKENRGSKEGYRIPTLRECASLQSFPITYQFWAQNISPKYKLVGNAVPPMLSRAIARAILIVEGRTPPDEPIIRKKVTEIPEVLPVDAISRGRLRTNYRLNRHYCDFIDHHANHSRTGCRIDIDNEGKRPKEHPMYSGKHGWRRKVIRHIKEWRCVLYTGYAKNAENMVVSLKDALSLLNDSNPLEFNKKMTCIIDDIINKKIHEIPDATTCQGILSGKVKGIKESPLWIRKMLTKIVNDNFPEKEKTTNKIKDYGRIHVRSEIMLTQRDAAQLIIAALTCAVMNESDVWLLENWGKHFWLKEWPVIEKLPYKESKWVKKIEGKIKMHKWSGDTN